ncbi:vanadium-dependent haloperoxidase [Actinophytocola sp.]|uniref:vanadium-dependent haloperoxidase n=1 Tax=Actinophytocola sp. TaxID=1872138 RepID=UPI002ED2AE31
MVSGAVYDAVNAIEGRPYDPYLVAPRTNGTESTDAAVGTAAYRVLESLFPDQEERLSAQYADWLDAIPDGRAKLGGIRVGERTAAAMIAAREDDGAFGNRLWTEGTGPGEWRPTPPGFENSGAWVMDLRPFLIPNAAMFRTAGPPALTSRQYARDLNEVKRLGSATSTARTADQTEAARWWHDRRSVHWEIKRQLAVTQRLSALATARLFALVDMTGEDGSIACQNDKEFWSFWRPVTAIRLADTDGNPRTTADPNWTPLLVTPPFPDYPSGHSCGTGARMAAYERIFGTDEVAFSAFSVDSGTTRHFDSFSAATTEVIGARIWGGIHFHTADVNGVGLGEAVAAYTTENHFLPRR